LIARRQLIARSGALIATGAIAFSTILATSASAALAAPPAPGGPPGPPAKTCQLGDHGQVKHVIYLQFDNTHYNSDASGVASDLQQMPHLLDFLTKNGTLFTNDHTILISHTAGGILSSLTGLYPDRQGQTVSNAYGYFPPSGVPAFSSSFKYWTSPVDPVADTKPNMITDTGLTTPAPWVPFTRAGCDVGGVGTANLELENNSTASTGDITNVFGNGSPEWNETVANPQRGQTDFVGIAIHCSQATSSACATDASAKPDPLPAEPGGYTGFKALYGAKYVDPAIAKGSACVNDTSGAAITDPVGICGFPGFDGMLAKNTLGYVAAMQESGVPVTYGYISDAHDLHVPVLSSDSYSSSATGPGELAHEQQLKAYDDAFAAFFDDLQHHGINKDNSLFVITVDEGDHFAGGTGTPQAGQNWLVYDHRTCTILTACPSNQIGEVGANIKALLATTDPTLSTANYDIHTDDAPTFYVNGQPGPTDPTVRKLERAAASTSAIDPYENAASVRIAQRLADPVEEQALHMVNDDPSRTPTFTMFGNPDFFFQTSNPCTNLPVCVTPGFAWNHGDFQDEIGSTWVGFVGPGVNHAKDGVNATTWTDHTNVRPTILSLVGLKDDYVDDGRVLVEALKPGNVPHGLSTPRVQQLLAVYEQLNASFGGFAMDTLKASTKALGSNDAGDGTYTSIEASIASLTSQRNALATQIKAAFNNAAFNGATITDAQASGWITQANTILASAHSLPS
jgi:hypothetical protein